MTDKPCPFCASSLFIDEWNGWVWTCPHCETIHEYATHAEVEKWEKMMNKISIRVFGKPIPKGSTKAFKHSKTNKIITMQQNSDSLYAWQDKISYEMAKYVKEPSREAFKISIIYSFVKPVSAKKKREYPTVRPDIDKLDRAVLDALTGIVYYDDSQIVQMAAQKIYGDNFSCTIEIQEV